MSSEQNVPEVEVHQGPPPAPEQWAARSVKPTLPRMQLSIPHGMGQSKSSRRRRRKRKNKGTRPAGAQGGAGQFGGDTQANGQGFAAPVAQPPECPGGGAAASRRRAV